MILTATGLIVLGGLIALWGIRLTAALLPLAGFVSGVLVGFGGVQAVFGTGAFSLTVSIIMALLVGIIMAILSYLFFGLGVMILAAVVGAGLFTYLGLALGLSETGFVMFLLGLAGAILGFRQAANGPNQAGIVIAVTAFAGVSFIMAGLMLGAGDVTLDQLQADGVIRTTMGVVDQQFVWLLAWIGGSLLAANLQGRLSRVPASSQVTH